MEEGMGGNEEFRMQNLELKTKKVHREDAKSQKGKIRMTNGEGVWRRIENEGVRVNL
jgi:hypothetical protein